MFAFFTNFFLQLHCLYFTFFPRFALYYLVPIRISVNVLIYALALILSGYLPSFIELLTYFNQRFFLFYLFSFVGKAITLHI